MNLEMNYPVVPLVEVEQVLLASKKATATDCNNRLALGVDLLPHVMGELDLGIVKFMPFQVTDIREDFYDWGCHIRRDRLGNPKPEVYGAEWRRFVREKDLMVGDELRFYQNHNPGPAVFMVTVRKVASMVRLFGEDIITYADEI